MNRSIDIWLVAIIGTMLVLGLIMVYSASAVVAGDWTGDGSRYMIRQVAAMAIGGGLAAITALTPTKAMRRYRWAIYGAILVALVFTYIPGIQQSAKGAERWIGFGSVNLQPSEFAKVGVLLVMAHFLDRWRGYMGDWRVLAQAALIPLPALALILGQPDFGTTAIISGLCFIMLYVAGMRPAHILLVSMGGLAAGIPALVFEPYRLKRLVSFLAPFDDVHGSGHQIIQSWIAMHSGGLWGQGLGNSLAKLHFLPEPWTDFIGSVIAEELGWLRLVLVVALFGAFVWRGLHIAHRARDAFGTFLAATITAMIGFEALFNFAVIMGLVPTKGLVLPFISYGSSAMIANLWAIGILLSIAAEADEAPVTAGWPNRKRELPRSTSSLPSVAK
jgi:cell division protein FtsW